MDNENAKQSAFPLVYDGGAADAFCHNGLTKREYFAAMAMQGMLANPALYEIAQAKLKPHDIADFYTEAAVDHADSLLKGLAK